MHFTGFADYDAIFRDACLVFAHHEFECGLPDASDVEYVIAAAAFIVSLCALLHQFYGNNFVVAAQLLEAKYKKWLLFFYSGTRVIMCC